MVMVMMMMFMRVQQTEEGKQSAAGVGGVGGGVGGTSTKQRRQQQCSKARTHVVRPSVCFVKEDLLASVWQLLQAETPVQCHTHSSILSMHSLSLAMCLHQVLVGGAIGHRGKWQSAAEKKGQLQEALQTNTKSLMLAQHHQQCPRPLPA